MRPGLDRSSSGRFPTCALVLLTLLLLPAARSLAVDIVVRVLEKGSGAPVEGATVVLGETDTFDTTDARGDVRFVDVPRPENIKVLAVGYAARTQKLGVEDELRTVYLEPVVVEGEGLEVVAERLAEKVSKISLEQREIVNAAGSLGDPLQSITSLPGVVPAYEGSGLVYLRGSGAGDNIIWVNRAPVGYLYHLGGFQSTINPALVEDFNIFLGGFPVEYGDSLGGAIDVKLRTPRRDRMRYHLDLSTIMASFLVEGPLGSSDGADSFFLAGRRSYIDLLVSPADLNALFEDEGEGDDPDRIIQVPEFYDYQALYHRRLENGALELSLFGAGDSMSFEINDSARSDPQIRGELDSSTSYWTLGLNWRQRWSSRLDQVMVLTYSRTESDFQIGTDDSGAPFYMKTTTDQVLWQPELHWVASETQEISGGIAVDYRVIPVDVYMSRLPSEEDVGFDFTTEKKYRFSDELSVQAYGPYLKQRLRWNAKTVTTLGLRYADITVTGGHHSQELSPRGSVEYTLTPDTLLTASLGRYVQIPDGGTLIEGYGNPNLGVTKADHAIVGIQYQATPLYSLKAEGYYKRMTDLVVADSTQAPPDNYANAGDGEAWGVDLFLKRKPENRRMGWVSLSYGKSTRTNELTGETRDFAADRPYALTVVWGQPFPGSWHRWLWSLRFQLHDGSPYTEVVGRHRENANDPDSRWIPEYGEHNGARTPLYYKLDARVSREVLFDKWKLNFYIDLQNATFHENVLGYDYGDEYEKIEKPTPVTGLLFFPFIGVETRF